MNVTRGLAIGGLAVLAVGLAGCDVLRPGKWLGSGPEEQRPARLAGTTSYACADNKQFALRQAGPKSVMVVFPEREFRLDAVDGAGGRYSNGRTNLTLNGETAVIDEAGAPQFTDCKRAAA